MRDLRGWGGAVFVGKEDERRVARCFCGCLCVVLSLFGWFLFLELGGCFFLLGFLLLDFVEVVTWMVSHGQFWPSVTRIGHGSIGLNHFLQRNA